MPGGGKLLIATRNGHLDADYAAEHPEVAPGDYALIEVTDSGTGIPPDIAAKIFEPFFTTKETGKGSGLGLSMIYGFMKQSKGHVSVYSEPASAPRSASYLPRSDQQAESAAMAPAAIENLRGNGEVVLAVEDVAVLRKVVVRQLDDLGYKVLEAENAAAALAVLAERPVDILFTDVILARRRHRLRSGARREAALARSPPSSSLPVSPTASSIPGAGPTNGARLLGKPFRKEDLAKALRNALNA